MIKLLKDLGWAKTDKEAENILLWGSAAFIVIGVVYPLLRAGFFSRKPEPKLPPVSQWPIEMQREWRDSNE